MDNHTRADYARMLEQLRTQMSESSGIEYRALFNQRTRKYSLRELAGLWRAIHESGKVDDVFAECTQKALTMRAEHDVRTDMAGAGSVIGAAHHLHILIEDAPDCLVLDDVWGNPARRSTEEIAEVAIHDAAVAVLLSLLDARLGRRRFVSNVMELAITTELSDDSTITKHYVTNEYRDVLRHSVGLLGD